MFKFFRKQEFYLPILGTLIGGFLAIIGQCYIQDKDFAYKERKMISEEFPKYFERLNKCKSDLFQKTFDIADYIDVRELKDIDPHTLEQLKKDFKDNVQVCRNGILATEIFLYGVRLKDPDSTKNMLADIERLNEKTTAVLKSPESFRNENKIINIELGDIIEEVGNSFSRNIEKIVYEIKSVN